MKPVRRVPLFTGGGSIMSAFISTGCRDAIGACQQAVARRLTRSSAPASGSAVVPSGLRRCAVAHGGAVVALFGGPLIAPAAAASQTFTLTGAAQWWTVPEGVTQATFDVYGAQGGDGYFSGGGGLGGRATATIPVIVGETLQINVGGAGGSGAGGAGGFNGGGDAGEGNRDGGGGGGGASDVRDDDFDLDDRILIAGGGGGTGYRGGGDGGGPTGMPAPPSGPADGGGGTADAVVAVAPEHWAARTGSPDRRAPAEAVAVEALALSSLSRAAVAAPAAAVLVVAAAATAPPALCLRPAYVQ
jgi:hypothetical protein